MVDDDPDAARLVQHALEREGFEVPVAYTGEEALSLLRKTGLPHLAIIDYALGPGINGFELGRRLRQMGKLPLLMLTALDDGEKIVEGLEEFADDYIVKPFKVPELIARVNRILRRVSSFDYTESAEAQAGPRLAVDFSRREAEVEGEVISLTPTESKVLYVLMQNAGRTVSTDFLLRKVWPFDDDAQEDRLHVHIHRLRRKLEPDGNGERYIFSDRGEGYRFSDTLSIE